MAGDERDLSGGHEDHGRTDFWGTPIHETPDGWVAEKSDIFGGTVHEDENGGILNEEKDVAGNTVLTGDDGQVVTQLYEDSTGNTVFVDEETGAYVVEHETFGDNVAFRGDLDGFNHNNDDVPALNDEVSPEENEKPGLEANEKVGGQIDNLADPVTPNRNVHVNPVSRRLQRAEVRRRPLDVGGFMMKAVNFIKWGFIIGFVLYHMIMSVLFVYWVLFVPK